MTVTLDGIYKEGKIELLGRPEGLPEGPVRVIVIASAPRRDAPRYLTYGKYKGDIPPEAFQEAEWHGEAEFDDVDVR